jgi:hypothetical protein
MKSQVMRSREGDLDHWVQVTGEPLDQNLRGYRVSGVQGLKEFIFESEVTKCQGSRARMNM